MMTPFNFKNSVIRRIASYSMMILLVIACAVPAAMGVTFPTKPGQGVLFVDEASLLTPADSQGLKEISDKLLKEKEIPLVVVTIKSLASHEAESLGIEAYTQKLFDTWGVGTQKKNYGMVLLVSVQDRKARIEFGKDWNHRYDQDAQSIMSSILVPAFKNGDYSKGILEGSKALDRLARGLPALEPVMSDTTLFIIGFLFISVVVAIIISLFRSGKSGWAWLVLAGLVAMILWAVNSGKGGGGFGGGSSGGGGATGEW